MAVAKTTKTAKTTKATKPKRVVNAKTGAKIKAKETAEKLKGKNSQFCTCCGEQKEIEEFYVTNSALYKVKGRMPYCKECLFEIYDATLKECQGDERIAIFKMCQMMGTVFLDKYFESAREQAGKYKTRANVFRIYMQKVNSLPQVNSFSFSDGEEIPPESIAERKALKLAGDITDTDKANRETVINMLKYDPFENDTPEDRKFLFNRIVDMLDDSILEDQMLLMSTIAIVRGFNQIEDIDKQISVIKKDLAKGNNAGTLKTLTAIRKDTMKSILDTAKDNGISANFNKNKGVGSGTMSGMIKRLKENGFDESKPNLFSIEISESMRQSADISHKSIMQQLNMDESEYSNLIAEQRELVIKLQKQVSKAEEQLRRLKIYMRSEGMEYNNLPEIIETDFTDEELLTDKEKGKLHEIMKLESGGEILLLSENDSQSELENEEENVVYIEEDIDF